MEIPKQEQLAGTGSDGIASNPITNPPYSQIANIILNDDAGTINGSENNNFAENVDSLVDLTIAKTHSPAKFGEESDNGFFEITVENIESGSTSGTITVTDNLPTGTDYS